MPDRQQDSYLVRVEAAELARSRSHPDHKANGDEQRYAGAKYFMSFTKGLPHNPDTGLLEDPQDFVEYRRAIDDGFIDSFSDRVRHGAKYVVPQGGGVQLDPNPPDNFRQWEAPTAGVVFELEGPDAQSVTMPPAPPLLDVSGNPNPELVLEMAEVYELAILRDQPFNKFENGKTNFAIDQSIERLNALRYVKNQTGRPRKVNNAGHLDAQTLFRGSSPGVEVGPYLSQFLLIGNTDRNGGGSVDQGLVSYGVLQVNQKVPVAKPGEDYMRTMDEYVTIQRGINPRSENYLPESNGSSSPRPARRFISTPRDLATYVHYDALYEAYLNACIILLEMKTPFDPSFDHLSGVGEAASDPATRRNAGGFALYGGPHILNLVTEVATRALKAVRFQKFNNHIRLRPEALAARIELVRRDVKAGVPESLKNCIAAFLKELQPTLNELGGNYFLPMAFPEGSPMHPAYGAGHATVAGACVTILKAFFDTSAVLAKTSSGTVAFKRLASGDTPILFRAPNLNNPSDIPTENLVPDTPCQSLTLEGELNKLAANISIGRDMAGVHYFSDYFDSLRMGEEIAIGILEEQALTYSTDPFVLSVPTFDGDVIRIGSSGSYSSSQSVISLSNQIQQFTSSSISPKTQRYEGTSISRTVEHAYLALYFVNKIKVSDLSKLLDAIEKLYSSILWLELAEQHDGDNFFPGDYTFSSDDELWIEHIEIGCPDKAIVQGKRAVLQAIIPILLLVTACVSDIDPIKAYGIYLATQHSIATIKKIGAETKNIEAGTKKIEAETKNIEAGTKKIEAETNDTEVKEEYRKLDSEESNFKKRSQKLCEQGKISEESHLKFKDVVSSAFKSLIETGSLFRDKGPTLE